MWFVPLIMAAAGAATGAISIWQQGERTKKELKHQKESAWQQYLYGKEYSDTRFGIQKNEALSQLNVQKQNLRSEMELSMDDYNTGLLAQAFGMHNAQIENASNIGMSLAAEGAGGTRGNEANETIRSYAAESLQRNIDVQNRQSGNRLDQMMTGAAIASAAIKREESSWQPGGYRMLEKDAQDAYNKNIAMAGQSEFDWGIEQSKPTFLDYATAFMGGGMQGYQAGKTFRDYGENWGNKNMDWNNIFGKKS